MKLQDAYSSETGAAGTGDAISYSTTNPTNTEPLTLNFTNLSH